MNGPFLEDCSLSHLNLFLRLPFVTALGQKSTSHNLSITVQLSDGSIGCGEASESLAMPSQTQASMAKALKRIHLNLIGKSVANLKQLKRLCRQAWELEPDFPTAVAALECALFDAFCRNQRQSLWRFFGAKKRSLRTSYTISVWPAALAARVTRQIYQKGFRRIKIKVSGTIDEDLKRVQAVWQAAPGASLWIDANQGFSVNLALQFLSELKRFKIPILFFEQPLPKQEWKGLAELRSKAKVAIALDESLQDIADARRIDNKNLAEILNIKLAKSGITRTLEIMKVAQHHKIGLMIGCMAESAQGLTPSVQLAAGSGVFDYVDLDSHLLIESPIEADSFTTEGDRLKTCLS